MLFFSIYRWFSRASKPQRWGAAIVFLLLLAGARPSQAEGWAPAIGFVQYGVAEDTRATTAGVIWPWRKAWSAFGGQWSGYWEAAIGRWSAPGPDGRERAWATQFGLTPVLRWRGRGGESPWFAEAGIGLTVVTPIYRSRSKRFSTGFNFGDHLAVGRNFGAQGQHELSLRYQHFSNGGIEHPNPGEDFVQLRYARSFR
ncbi:acyloxyacyl hydrolase [Aquabacterium sp. A7-Y]|uniref:acyloxyacyl hydrolase n=1 Tax=Aquabacterium sp. A7-Y TaxID=1349605 RepID=UPI00223D6A14|nr:acyloxyacyl hydrolase [Aquabacterium sp. A7-Y]MCW7537836.1 acyloxyacyl hydrolase [Aquabacterium sp. A7-Y]